MKIQTLKYTMLSLVLATSLNVATAATSAKDVVKNVQKKYQQLKSLQADFKQEFKWELAGETQMVTGKIYLMDGDKYRIETELQEIITDGSTVWTFSKNSSQVIIDKLDKSNENPLPRDLFFKYSEEYEPVYVGEESIDGNKTHVLNLVPKDEEALIKSMKIWVDGDSWLTRKIEQTDINDNVNTYTVSNIRDNIDLKPSLFKFQVKDDFEVVDLRPTH